MALAIFVLAGLAIGLGIGLLACALRARKGANLRVETAATAAAPAQAESGSVDVIRPNANTVEGLEIRYQQDGLVRSVRVGAMNCEHKELLLTMDDIAWRAMPNAQKQEVLAAARSTWAAKMCPAGPDIAYVVIKTERGEIVGRASPRTVTIL